ncbi:uncharacterized protein LOC130047325 [Ostrea edulis]|uniref:uncharacterized protein LOC130047325 n=1 Tax=Ostrea edulis TaxID=37623 RepID=UPI0024AF17C2|nr:uncharacterized protein LOC130047325 [Ostrea edulis]
MTSPRRMIESLLGPKEKLCVGAWNVRTMFETSKTAQVADEMQRYGLDILGVSECRWLKSGKMRVNSGHTILYSGHDDKHQSGVAIMISKEKIKTLLEWEPINDRLIRARFNSKYCKLTIIQCYAPTNDVEEEIKDDFYEQLQMVVSKVPQHDMLLMMGDLNAKVGADNTDCERSMGKHGCGIRNDNGERLVDFCLNNNLMIGGTIFPHKDIHKLTWKSPDGRTTNQIDHMIINNKWRRSLYDVKVYRGADVNSDHYLLKATIKLKLRRDHQQQGMKRKFDIDKLKIPNINKAFNLELKNRFKALENNPDDQDNIQGKWDTIKETYVETAAKTLGYRTKKNKEWLTSDTWERISERKKLKQKIISTKSTRLQEQMQISYREKDKEVKRSARKDSRMHLDNLAKRAEHAASHGEMSVVYKITKQLCGKNTTQPALVKDKDGHPLSTDHEQAKRWVQYFQEVLNCPEPDEPTTPVPAEEDLEIDLESPTLEEVKKFYKKSLKWEITWH